MRSGRLVYVCDKEVKHSFTHSVHLEAGRGGDPNRVIIEQPCRRPVCACTEKERGHECRTNQCTGTLRLEIVDDQPYH